MDRGGADTQPHSANRFGREAMHARALSVDTTEEDSRGHGRWHERQRGALPGAIVAGDEHQSRRISPACRIEPDRIGAMPDTPVGGAA